MPTQTFVTLGTSGPQEVVATTTSAGSADAGKIVGLDPAGRLDSSLMPVGIGADTYTGNAFEALTAGAFVYIKADGTVANASAASGGVAAVGFVLAASASGASAVVYFEGRNTAKTGLTVGTTYFLSDTVAGGVMTTPPSGTGKLYQVVGTAISSTSLNTEMSQAVIRA
jgi:hypothetical protein